MYTSALITWDPWGFRCSARFGNHWPSAHWCIFIMSSLNTVINKKLLTQFFVSFSLIKKGKVTAFIFIPHWTFQNVCTALVSLDSHKSPLGSVGLPPSPPVVYVTKGGPDEGPATCKWHQCFYSLNAYVPFWEIPVFNSRMPCTLFHIL